MNEPRKIIIVGGSCAGLFAGILLKRQGHDVHILESATSNEREGTAAGVSLASHVGKFFAENDRLKDVPFGTPNDFMEICDWNMNVQAKMPIYSLMTTWEATYYRLRANFDAYKSAFYESPPPLEESEGAGLYDIGKKVLTIKETATGLEILTEEVKTGIQKAHHADFVIAADGCNSSIRQQLQSGLQREEPGYILWRGMVPVKLLSQFVLDRVRDRLLLYQGLSKSYAIIYTCPGLYGTMKEEEREINIAWYTWVTRSELADIMTDKSGHRHRTTLPKGHMRPEIWAKQLEQARRNFNPEIFQLVENIKEPLISNISSFASKQAAFFGNKLFLIGDALAQKQPNTAQGVNMAALDAMSLVAMLNGEMSPQQWEFETLERAERERLRSVTFGTKYLNSWPVHCIYQLRYQWLLLTQRLWRWWLRSR